MKENKLFFVFSLCIPKIRNVVVDLVGKNNYKKY